MKRLHGKTWKSLSKYGIQIAPAFGGFRNADESKHITRNKKKFHHTNVFPASHLRKILALRIRNIFES